jgi:hypothetical protein
MNRPIAITMEQKKVWSIVFTNQSGVLFLNMGEHMLPLFFKLNASYTYFKFQKKIARTSSHTTRSQNRFVKNRLVM